MKFSFLSKSGYAQQAHKHITMSRGNSAGTANVGYIMHELGHQAGNNGLYAAYRQAVPSRRGTSGRCMVTNYCGKDYSVPRERNEEFAEVWAAYLTNPAMLKAKGGACEAAYNFFRNRVFPNSKGTPCHDPGNGGINKNGERLGQLDPAKCESTYSPRSNVGDVRALGEYLGDIGHAQEMSSGADSCGFFRRLFGLCGQPAVRRAPPTPRDR